MSRHSDVNMLRFRPFALGLLAVCALAGAARAAAPSPEPPITATGAEGDYLRAMHRAIHFRWASLFIEDVLAKRPPTDPLNKLSLETEILFTVRWDGSPAEVTVAQSSGVAAFDQAAIAAVKGDRPLPVPPIDVYGDDGVAHFRWIFARDARLCSGGRGAPGRGAAGRGAAAPLLSGADQGGAPARGPLHAQRRRQRDVDVRARLAGAAATRPRARCARRRGAGPRGRRASGRPPPPGAQSPRHPADRGAGAGGAEGRPLRTGAPPSQAGRSRRHHVRHPRPAGGGRRAARGLALRGHARRSVEDGRAPGGVARRGAEDAGGRQPGERTPTRSQCARRPRRPDARDRRDGLRPTRRRAADALSTAAAGE